MSMDYPKDCGSGDSMKLDSGQKFGIGTSSPSEAIHVKESGDTKIKCESTSSNSALYLVSGSDGWTIQTLTGGALRFYEVGSGEHVKFQAGGNVGIGTGSPGEKLEVDGNVKLDGDWREGHLMLGNYHIWVDSSGKLRIKYGSPTSGTDGTVVGTQS